jgi:hypothetical protein
MIPISTFFSMIHFRALEMVDEPMDSFSSFFCKTVFPVSITLSSLSTCFFNGWKGFAPKMFYSKNWFFSIHHRCPVSLFYSLSNGDGLQKSNLPYGYDLGISPFHFSSILLLLCDTRFHALVSSSSPQFSMLPALLSWQSYETQSPPTYLIPVYATYPMKTISKRKNRTEHKTIKTWQ